MHIYIYIVCTCVCTCVYVCVYVFCVYVCACTVCLCGAKDAGRRAVEQELFPPPFSLSYLLSLPTLPLSFRFSSVPFPLRPSLTRSLLESFISYSDTATLPFFFLHSADSLCLLFCDLFFWLVRTRVIFSLPPDTHASLIGDYLAPSPLQHRLVHILNDRRGEHFAGRRAKRQPLGCRGGE